MKNPEVGQNYSMFKNVWHSCISEYVYPKHLLYHILYVKHTYLDIYDAARACEFVHRNLIGSHSISGKVCRCVHVGASMFWWTQGVNPKPAHDNKIIGSDYMIANERQEQN